MKSFTRKTHDANGRGVYVKGSLLLFCFFFFFPFVEKFDMRFLYPLIKCEMLVNGNARSCPVLELGCFRTHKN